MKQKAKSNAQKRGEKYKVGKVAQVPDFGGQVANESQFEEQSEKAKQQQLNFLQEHCDKYNRSILGSRYERFEKKDSGKI